MLVKRLEELAAQGRDKVLAGGKVRSSRFLTKADGMGFSMHDVRVSGDTDQTLWYKHHWEANYIVEGSGTVENLGSGQSWALEPGVIYIVGPKDRHRVRTEAELRIISVFNPPLSGDETHDADGAFPPTGDVPPGRGTMFVKSVAALRAQGRERVVAGGSARTVRALLQEDGLGFTVCDVNLAAGNDNVLWYKHHWEANYILAGEGEVVDLETQRSWPLAPGVMYIVGPKDRHSMRPSTDLHLLSVFNPPLKGDEMHDAEGTIPPSGPIPPGPPGA